MGFGKILNNNNLYYIIMLYDKNMQYISFEIFHMNPNIHPKIIVLLYIQNRKVI